jgi:hypothetical protein
MAIIAGGHLAYGGIQQRPGDVRVYLNSPDQINSTLDEWGRLTPDPRGGDGWVFRGRINQSDYAKVPALNQTTHGKRAELTMKKDLASWGMLQCFYWRFIIDPLWRFEAGETTTVIHQIHELGETASPPVNPVLAAVYGPAGYQVIWAHDAIGGQNVIHTDASIQPGDEVEVFLRVRWADVSHVPAAQGIFELTVNGTQVFAANGVQNTWNVPEDVYPPYMTAGVYRFDPETAWWANKEKTMYHIAMCMADGSETLESIRAHVSSQLTAS